MLRFVGGVGEDVMWDQGNGSSHDHENGRSPNWGITLTATPNQRTSKMGASMITRLGAQIGVITLTVA